MNSETKLSNECCKKQKRPMQFSKKMCVWSFIIMIWTIAMSFIGELFLQYTGRGTMEAVVTSALSLISFVTVFINGGYITQNIFRDTSLNKHKLNVDGERKKHIESPVSTDIPI